MNDGHTIDGIPGHVLLGVLLLILGAVITVACSGRRGGGRGGNAAWLAYFGGLMALFPAVWLP